MSTKRSGLNTTQWLICIIAAIGFAFDTYELLVAPLILQPALIELTGLKPGSPAFNDWVSMLFYVPALVGGFFGLIGGYLTDLLGRRRVLTFSILLYAFSAVGAGLATSAEMLLFFRVTTFAGVCIEFVAAVAWLAELFPDAKQRENVLGYTQAFASLGGIMVTLVFGWLVVHADSLPAVVGGHQVWRYTLISGVIPAIPLILIRPFLPESPVWQQKKDAGTLRRPSFAELFAPQYRQVTIVTAILVACGYGAAFGAIQQLPRIVPGLPGVSTLAQPLIQATVKDVQLYQELGGLLGRGVLAFLAFRFISRRSLLRVFQIPGLIIVPLVFFYPATNDLELLKWGVFIAGFCTVAQFSFWGNYLPSVYPVHLRGTGESFAANVGGRMVGTMFAAVTVQLSNSMPGTTPPMKLAYAAGAVALFVYAVGTLVAFKLPEPKPGQMEE